MTQTDSMIRGTRRRGLGAAFSFTDITKRRNLGQSVMLEGGGVVGYFEVLMHSALEVEEYGKSRQDFR